MAGRHEVVARAFDRRRAQAGAEPPSSDASVASDLALLVAHEAARAEDERKRREEIELTASQLAVLVAHEHAELERERSARERAEAEAEELRGLIHDWHPETPARRRATARR